MESEDEELKFQNELEKLKMKAEFGASFFEGGDGSLPPEIEAAWLESVRNFETTHESTEQKKLGEILGHPKFIPLSELAPENVETELNRIFELLAEKGIELDHDEDLPVSELYRFVTEELMDHETEVYDMPGWQTHLIYEEFHPNHEKDIIRHCESFCKSLFEQNPEWLGQCLDPELVFASGATMTNKELVAKAETWFDSYESFKVNRLLFKRPEYDLAQNMGHVHSYFDYDANLDDGTTVHFEGPGIFYMHLMHDYWCICGMDFPGFKEWAGV